MSVLLAKNYSSDIDPCGWHASIKFDGLRAIWDGQQLTSRNGNVFSAPREFLSQFPSIKMDGELYLGNKKFEETSSIVRSASTDKGWHKLSYMAFDIPDPAAGPVEQRWGMLQAAINATKSPFIKYTPQTTCLGHLHLMVLLDVVVKNGGEGIMLRRPGSRYETKRSNTLLKVKRFFDAEAKVIGHQVLINAGRPVAGAVGALECITEKGVAFKIGTGFTDEQRRNPPPIGSIVTYKYQELSKNNCPRFPVFIRVREKE